MNNIKTNRIVKFSFSLLLLISIIFMPFLKAEADVVSLPEKPENIYVYDSAEVLSESCENELYSKALNLYNHTKTQISVVTVKTLNGASIENYANELLSKWEIGGENGRGLILVLDIEEDIYVTISGNELKSKFTSEVLQTVLNEKLEPFFLVSQYEDGVNAFITDIYYMAEDFAEELEESDVQEESKPAADKNDNSSKKEGASFFDVLLTIILILLLLVIIFFIVVYVRGQMVLKKRREAARRRREAERRTQRSRRDYL